MGVNLHTIEKLKQILAPNGFSEDGETIAPLLSEWRGSYHGNTPILLMPNSTKQVQEVVKLANIDGFKITVQGGNTGLVGGQIPFGEVLLSTKNIDEIMPANNIDDCIIVGAGAILDNVEAAASLEQRRFPLKLASGGSATIGGLISTNAGGVHVRKYGMMRNLVLGIEAVLPNGEIYNELSPLRKDNTGYDLKQFLIGAEGSLGIITKACLKLVARPKHELVAVLGFDNCDKAIETMHRLETDFEGLSAFEIMNQQALEFGLKNLAGARNPLEDLNPFTAVVEFGSNDGDLAAKCEKILWRYFDEGLILDAVLSQNESQISEFWALREGMSAAQKPEGRAAKHDISVPISKISQFLNEAELAAKNIVAGARIVAFGHISDGNIHYDVCRPIDMPDDKFQEFVPQIQMAVNDVAIGLGGSISAEHGIGIARRAEFLSREPKAHLAAMKAIKAALDPNNVLNPRLGFE